MLASKLALAVASLTLVGLVSLGSVSVGVEAVSLLELILELPNLSGRVDKFERDLNSLSEKDIPIPEFGGYTVNQVLSCAWSKDYSQCTKEEFSRRSAMCKDFSKLATLPIFAEFCNWHLGIMTRDCALHAHSSVSINLSTISDYESLENFERQVTSRSAGTSYGRARAPDLSEAVSALWQAITEDERQKVKLVCQSFTSKLERLIGLDGEFKNHCSLLQICLQVARLRVR
jgi:hypothetical protein